MGDRGAAILGQEARGGGLRDAQTVGGKADLPRFGQCSHEAKVAEFQPLAQKRRRVFHNRTVIGLSSNSL